MVFGSELENISFSMSLSTFLHLLPRVTCFLCSCQEYLPDLYSHFLNVGLEAHMYASQWFLTLFTAKFPLYMVFHIIDLLLCEVSKHTHARKTYVYCQVLSIRL